MKASLLLALLAPAIAHAQAPGADQPAAPVEPAQSEQAPPTHQYTMVEKLTLSARSAARRGHCASLLSIGERVRQLDPVYFANVFAVDPEIANCSEAPGVVAPSPMAQPFPQADVMPSGEYKNPATAVLLSLGVTAGGIGLILVGDSGSNNGGALATFGAIAMLVGPTVGHTYAGKTWNAGLATRLVGLGATYVGIYMAITDKCAYNSCRSNDNADVVLMGGVITFIGGSIYEIATAGSAARDYNREHHLDARLTFAPVRSSTGAAPGLALVGRF
jgi:hypothetical protein